MITIKPSPVRWQQPGPLLVECAACENSSEQSCAARRHGATGERGAGAVRRHCHPDCGHGVGITTTPSHLRHPSHNPQLVCDNFNINIARYLEKVPACWKCQISLSSTTDLGDKHTNLMSTYRIYMFTLPFSIVPTILVATLNNTLMSKLSTLSSTLQQLSCSDLY